MRYILFIIAFFFFYSCKIDSSVKQLSDKEKSLLSEFQMMNEKNRLTIADETELGHKLFLCLKFVDKESKRVLKEQEIKFYHTSSIGEYEPANPNDESTARLSGKAFTDMSGRIFVKTILPGNYGSGENNRHIHTTVKGAKPEGYDIHFKQHTGFMGKRFINRSDQHFLADLRYNIDSTLVTFLTIEVKRPKIQENHSYDHK